MNNKHVFNADLIWGDEPVGGTSSYSSYSRNHSLSVKGKPAIKASSAPVYRGDGTRYNPEELLVASLSSCHMLWYLHLCANAGVVVFKYEDHASGTMAESPDGSGIFTEVTLNPVVTVKSPEMEKMAMELHQRANKMCFIANSCNFPVYHRPIIKVLA